MRIVLSFILLLFPIWIPSQTISLGVSKDLKWAEWMYETIEFKDDCTILKGFFIPSKNGCWVRSNMDETLEANGKKYRIIFTDCIFAAFLHILHLILCRILWKLWIYPEFFELL